jgi:hypothetical protein
MQLDQRPRMIIADGLDERLGGLARARLAGLRVESRKQRVKALRARGLVRDIDAA